MNVVFAVTEVGAEAAAGDYFSALELAEALRGRFGCEVSLRAEGEGWYRLAGVDVVVAMVDHYDPRAIREAEPGLVRVAWARNWFERWAQQPGRQAFDVVLASSVPAARFLSERMGRRAKVLRLATNPQRFSPQGRAEVPRWEFVFTGSHWFAERDVVSALVALQGRYRGAVFGKNWDQVPSMVGWYQGFVPYAQLPEVYRQAAIVIDDANHVTKTWGAANSRVFDALAAGCLVITNSRSVSDEVFGGELPVYGAPQELVALVRQYVEDEPARGALVERLREQVLQRHQYRHRAFEFGLHLGWVGRQAGEGERRWPSVSFVVPLFNHLAQTQEMLSSLLASLPQGLDYEVILADDGSSDGTRAWLAQLREPRVRMLLNERNLGYACTNNVAVASARGEVLALVNNDLVFAPGWLEPMLEGLQDPRLRAAVVGNVQYRVADGALDHAGVELNASGQLVHVQTLPTAGERFVPVLAVTGACMVLRRATFVAVGGFDEAYCNGGEDVDLCLRLRERGGRIYVATQSRIGHHVSLSRGKVTARDEANSRRLFRRWRSVLRQELAARWAERLQADPLSWRELGDEEGMMPSLLRLPPPAAAQEIAERLLRRQEARWEAMGVMGAD